MCCFYFIIGTCWASFLTASAWRLLYQPHTFFAARSYCENCQHVLAFYELIPMISFLWQGGKCRHCRQRLTPLFLIGECLGGVAGLLIYRLPLVQQPLAGILSACLFFCAAMDCFENCLMPLWLLPFGAAAFCCAAHLYWLSAGAVTVLLYGLHCWHNGLGLGDVELILLLALFLTPSQIWFLLFAACCFALLGFLFLKTKQQQPFVPYLLLGYLITLIYF